MEIKLALKNVVNDVRIPVHFNQIGPRDLLPVPKTPRDPKRTRCEPLKRYKLDIVELDT